MDSQLTYPDIARIAGTGLISTGLGLLLFVLITITWGDPFTRLSEASEQRALTKELSSAIPPSSQLVDAGLDPLLTQRAAALAAKRTPLGEVAGRISIPKIGIDKAFIHGARDEDLSKGPGLYKEVRFPGSGQPIAIAGHRTTHGAPFLHIDELHAGDRIVLTMPYGRFTYAVTRHEIITPHDWSILDFGAEKRTQAQRRQVLRTGRCLGPCEHLVLTACHPKYSAAQRIAVFARLAHVQLYRGSARAGAAA